MALPYEKLLVPLDGSDLAAEALPHAVSLASKLSAQIILYQVVPDPFSISPNFAVSPLDAQSMELYRSQYQAEQLHQLWQQQAREFLQATMRPLVDQGIQVTTVVEVGEPAEAIIDYADRAGVDLIVMSTHGRTGLARWVQGSVATKVLHGAKCPVLVVRPIRGE